ncbi:hypothetical protein J2S41_003082 [Catenuloplanes atrovinosus]|uniref:Uncharacterized protein n=1 Tax=Catenuloplanes atrovinosus TaxID=137266 RepID=A0AAE3YM30_9ACTN|nr:hypothetical protein [Catenuloplanes atrovinosus]
MAMIEVSGLSERYGCRAMAACTVRGGGGTGPGGVGDPDRGSATVRTGLPAPLTPVYGGRAAYRGRDV